MTSRIWPVQRAKNEFFRAALAAAMPTLFVGIGPQALFLSTRLSTIYRQEQCSAAGQLDGPMC